MTGKLTFAWLVGSTVCWGMLGMLGCLLALATPMLFDAPGSERDPLTYLMMLSVLSFPLACGAAIVLSWLYHTQQRERAACWSTLLPLLSVLLGTLTIAAGMVRELLQA